MSTDSKHTGEVGGFFELGVRSMIRGDRVDRVIQKSPNQCLDIGRQPERRIELAAGIIALDILFTQEKVVRRDLTGNQRPGILRALNRLDGVCRRNLLNVKTRSRVLGHADVPVDRNLLADRGNPRQTEGIGNLSLVDRTCLGQGGSVAVGRHQQIEIPGIRHATPQQIRATDRAIGVGQHRHPSIRHSRETGQLLPFPLLGQASGSQHRSGTDFGNEILEALDQVPRVDRRRRVGHQDKPCHPSMKSRCGTGSQGLLVFRPRLPGVHMQVEHAGNEQAPRTVDDLDFGDRLDPFSDLLDVPFVSDEDISLPQLRRVAARNRTVLEKSRHQSCWVSGLSQCSTAIRTAIPFSTWVLMRLFS